MGVWAVVACASLHLYVSAVPPAKPSACTILATPVLCCAVLYTKGSACAVVVLCCTPTPVLCCAPAVCSQQIKPDFSNYDDAGAWPYLMDEFVEYMKKKNGMQVD